MNKKILYEDLNRSNKEFFEDYKRVFSEVLESGWFILGKNVSQFENEFAQYCGSRHCIGLASGLDALHIAIQSFDFPKNSEIIVPSNTYIATILAIINNGHIPILVEPDINTYNIDPLKIEEKISPKTKAILVVHLYGKCCEMDKILPIAKHYDLKIIEDCAQSHGAMFKDQKAGTFGDFGAFSFYPTKNLGALGDAGGITTNSDEFSEKVKTIRNYGSKIKYQNEILGMNSRLDEVQAAFLSIKLKHLDKINEHKRCLANIYFSKLNGNFILPQINNNYYDVYHIFNIRTENRDELKKYLIKNNIYTEIHYPITPNKQKATKSILDNTKTPIAEEIHRTTLSLPISYFHSENDITYVAEVLNSFKFI